MRAAKFRGAVPPPQVAPFYPLLHPEVCDKRELGAVQNWTDDEEACAQVWFQANVVVYVLNIDSQADRWQRISGHLDDLQIEATRIQGVDLRNAGAFRAAQKEGIIDSDFDFARASKVSKEPDQHMNGILGTVGCAAAHFRAQTKAMKGPKPLAIVLEDDASLSKDFVMKLYTIAHRELPCDWEVVALKSRCPYGICVSEHLTRVQPDGTEPASRCRHGVNYGFYGVLYRVSALASVKSKMEAIVWDEDRPHCLDVDVALASISDDVGFYAVPAVQDPGLLVEMDEGSARWDIDKQTDRWNIEQETATKTTA